MSTEKCHNWLVWTFLPVITLALSLSASDNYGGDQVLEFYCKQAAAESQKNNTFAGGLHVEVTAHSLFKRVGSDGRITSVDTAVICYWFTGGILDSQVVQRSTSDGIPPVTFVRPQVFSDDYLYTFFPNDPGGEMLSIGFDTPEDTMALPVGLAVISRDEYVLHRLYLHYPNIKGFKHLSRGFRLTDVGGYLFPDSIWEIGAKEGVFSTEQYRLETGVDSVIVDP